MKSLYLYSVCSALFTLVYGAIGIVLIGVAMTSTMLDASEGPLTHTHQVRETCMTTTTHDASCIIFHVPSWFHDCREHVNKVRTRLGCESPRGCVRASVCVCVCVCARARACECYICVCVCCLRFPHSFDEIGLHSGLNVSFCRLCRGKNPNDWLWRRVCPACAHAFFLFLALSLLHSFSVSLQARSPSLSVYCLPVSACLCL